MTGRIEVRHIAASRRLTDCAMIVRSAMTHQVAPVIPLRQSLHMLSIGVSALVLVATFLQTKLSAKDAGDAHRAAMDEWNVEDELVAEEPWWRHRAARRELEEMRDPDTANSIRHVERVLLSWALLLIASVAALVGSVVDFIGNL